MVCLNISLHRNSDLEGKHCRPEQILPHLSRCHDRSHHHRPSHRLRRCPPLPLQTHNWMTKGTLIHTYTQRASYNQSCVSSSHRHFLSAASSSHVWSSSWILWSGTLQTGCLCPAWTVTQQSDPSLSLAASLCLSASGAAVHGGPPVQTERRDREGWGKNENENLFMAAQDRLFTPQLQWCHSLLVTYNQLKVEK